MESNSNERTNPHETVTLILKGDRFKVEKQKLIDKSRYFAALLSPNYREYGQTECVIKYDISSNLLKDFVNWIHYDKSAFIMMTINCINDFDHLLMLLELSVLFAADNLIKDVTSKLERCYYLMPPKYAINIWSLALELNVNLLQDLFLAVCLNRFTELSLESIYELSRDKFLKLIGNVNLRCKKSYLNEVTYQWMIQNQDFTIPINIINNRKSTILYGIISCDSNNRKQFIHCWDGNNFFELTSFEYPPTIIEYCRSIGTDLEGAQITARSYDLYLCGGEYGGNSNRFNKNVWRYSLISKKWSLLTIMPVERKYMIAVILKNELFLVGGIGRFEEYLYTIDIYNIYTDVWVSRAKIKIPLNLPINSYSSDHFIFNDKLFIYQCTPDIHVYFPDSNTWETIKLNFIPHIARMVPILSLTMPCYIDVNDQGEVFLRTITETCNVKDCNHIVMTSPISVQDTENLLLYKFQSLEYINFYNLISPNQVYTNIVLFCRDIKCDLDNMLHFHSIPIKDRKKFYPLNFKEKLHTEFFILIDPAHLRATNQVDHN